MDAKDRLERVPEDWDRAVAIVAHPDDLEYGASSAIAKWTAAGKHVVYVLATSGEAGIDALPPDEVGPLREAEERASARLVGVEAVEFLGHRDGMIEYGLPLRRDLARAIRRHRPDVIITGSFELAWPSGMLNQADHRAVGLAALDAARDAGNRWVFPELRDEGLEPWSGTKRVFVSGSSPTHGCPIAEADLARGIASLQAHQVYFQNLGQEFDPDAFLRQWAVQGGQLLDCEYAIGFRVYQL